MWVKGYSSFHCDEKCLELFQQGLDPGVTYLGSQTSNEALLLQIWMTGLGHRFCHVAEIIKCSE
jgi:hypothetical protein